MRFPCIIPVRGGSKRLPDKWALPWDGQSLLLHCIEQVQQCPSVSTITVVSDSEEVLAEAAKAKPSPRLMLEPANDGEPGSFRKTLALYRRAYDLETAEILLVQCTSPFVNPTDIEHMCRMFTQDNPGIFPWRGAAVCDNQENQKATGMAYIFGPGAEAVWPEDADQFWRTSQTAPIHDINTQADYDAAVKARADWHNYNMDAHYAP